VQVWAEPPMDQITLGANISRLFKMVLGPTQPTT